MSKTDLETKPSPSEVRLNPKPQFAADESRKNSEPQSITAIASYSGPIPPPNFLAEYEKLYPGIAKKFLEEPHKEAEHRRSLENKIAEAQIKLANRGQWMAFWSTAVLSLLSFGLIYLGYSLEGLTALGALIAAVASVFFYSKRQH